jgi:hypothetical protein
MNDYLVWKKIIEEEEQNSKLKVGVNVYMVEKDEPIVDVCVTTRGQTTRMLEVYMLAEKLLDIEARPIKRCWKMKKTLIFIL